MTTPALSARNISKTFGHVTALNDVTFDAYPGEVLAIVGDNGAGKSTLIKTLSGVYDVDSGGLEIAGEPVEFRKPADATKAGIATVYQDLALVDTRDVASNLFLGKEFTKGLFVDRKRIYAEARAAVDRFSLKLPSVKVNVGMLSGGQRQVVAIARALVQGANVVIMDEPTAALGVTESAKVMEIAAQLRDSGTSVLVISHNLQQIWPVADRFLVMRLGRAAAIRRKEDTSIDELVKLIVYGAGDDAVQERTAGA
ncbi:ATP-binding cassette domain-containing protein [Lentzea sp. JNUCC 0626]|uniref:ATP-binding cassette domain-containing protein n=1 Tax=Lentzea sp. JNUCC 0626 TaxID=3367513 RepID=UPI003748DC88